MKDDSSKPNLVMALLGKAPGTPGGLGEYAKGKGDGDDDDDGKAPSPDPALKYAATDVMDAFKSGDASELKDALYAFVSMCK